MRLQIGNGICNLFFDCRFNLENKIFFDILVLGVFMKKIKKFLVYLCLLGIIGIFMSCFINEWVLQSTSKQILEESSLQETYDYILVLGAAVWQNEPSPMLKDRLDKAITLYNEKKATKILVSGDHREEDYDEVNVMRRYLIKKGIPAEDIFMDHAGLSTYESIYRTKEFLEDQKIIIVTQKYHLPRALYIANSFHLKAVGIPAKETFYKGEFSRECREFLARNKDFVFSILKPNPTYNEEEISVF